MIHTITTDADGQPTFTCTAPAEEGCHIWADCLSADGCESDDEYCKHAPVRHDHCIYSEWYARPADTISMYVNEDGDDGGPLPANVSNGRIDIEWDECPMWSFDPVHTNGRA